MKLEELISMAATSMTAGQPSVAEKLNVDIDSTYIYMLYSISLQSDLFFFDKDETEYDLIYIKEGVEYIAFLSFDDAIEMIEELLQLKEYTIEGLASRLIEYRVNDA